MSGEMKCIGEKAKDAHMLILMWEDGRMSRQKVTQSCMDEKWRRSKPVLRNRKERRFTRHCSTWLAFKVWCRNGTTQKFSQTKNKRKVDLCRQESEGKAGLWSQK